MRDPDEALVERTLRGELEAFTVLVERYRSRGVVAAARIAGVDEAEDVAQDAFLRAFHTIGSFRGEGPFEAWLMRIVRNTALNALTRRRTTPLAEPDEHARAVHLSTRPRAPADALESSEQRERLAQKLGMLSPHHRAVIALRDIEGLSYEEVAELTEAPLGSVKGRLSRARAELIELLRTNTYDWELPE